MYIPDRAHLCVPAIWQSHHSRRRRILPPPGWGGLITTAWRALWITTTTRCGGRLRGSLEQCIGQLRGQGQPVLQRRSQSERQPCADWPKGFRTKMFASYWLIWRTNMTPSRGPRDHRQDQFRKASPRSGGIPKIRNSSRCYVVDPQTDKLDAAEERALATDKQLVRAATIGLIVWGVVLACSFFLWLRTVLSALWQ